MLRLTLSRAAGQRGARDAASVPYALLYDGFGEPTVYGSQRGGELWLEVPGVARFHLPAGGETLTAIVEDPVDSNAVLEAYYGTALPLVVHAARGLEILHGSAVYVPSRHFVASFCGVSGSGKSTLAYGLAARRCKHWADDAVAFRTNADSVTVLGLPFTAKLRERSREYFKASGVDARPSAHGWTVVEDFEWMPARLGAVFLLEPRDQERSGKRGVEAERLDSGRALHALLSGATKGCFQPQTPARKRQTLQAYLEVVASVPILSLRFPRDLERLPDVLDEVERWLAELP